MQNKALYEALISAGADQAKAEAAAVATPDTSGLLYEILRQNNQILCELDSQKHRQMEFEQQANLRFVQVDQRLTQIDQRFNRLEGDISEIKSLLHILVKQKE